MIPAQSDALASLLRLRLRSGFHQWDVALSCAHLAALETGLRYRVYRDRFCWRVRVVGAR